MEYFDVVDKNGQPTGEVVSREQAHETGTLHRTAHVWITRTHNGIQQVLLQKRSANKDSFPNMYDTSSAGHIPAGDVPIQSACRELYEELGIWARDTDLQLLGTYHGQYSLEFHNKPFNDNEIVFVYIYDKPVNIANLVLQEEEVSEVKWFDIQDVIQGCAHRDGTFCVPSQGLELITKHITR